MELNRELGVAAAGIRRRIEAAVRDALSTLVAVDCPACGVSALGVCDPCRSAVRDAVDPVVRYPFAAMPEVPLVAATAYEGIVRTLISALKDRGRMDAVGPLASLARVALGVALRSCPEHPGSADSHPAQADPVQADPAHAGPAVLVPAPSRNAATRARGFVPVQRICEVAVPRAQIVRALAVRGSTRDQSGLDREQRAANLSGAMRMRLPLAGRSVVLVDDIVTTGATLREAVRALTAGGANIRAVAVIAHTKRRRPRSGA